MSLEGEWEVAYSSKSLLEIYFQNTPGLGN